MDKTTARIKDQISVALEGLGAEPMLQGIVAAWGDSLSDAEVLAMLKDWNSGTFKWARITSVDEPRPRPVLKVVR
jgi:hypothetical protein